MIAALLLVPGPAFAFEVKLWPLIDYHRDASGERRLHILGPLFSYESGPAHTTVALRPLFALTRGPQEGYSQLSVLYPLFVSHTDPERSEQRVLLLSYRTETAPRADEWDRRFTIFPFVFYRYSHLSGTWLSILPFYANVTNFLGYQRVKMVLLPFYLRLEEPLVTRTWAPFPFVSWTGGTLGRGFRIFPFYGWEQEGETARFEYVLWPFYIARERHFTRPERERQLIVAPFYSSIDTPTAHSRAYVGPFFTHTIDRAADTDTWGFPWPLWMSQRRLSTGERLGLRIAPFYEDTHFGTLHDQFVMWPIYRWSTQEVPSDTAGSTGPYRYTRSDVFLVVYRNIREEQPAYHRERRLRTLLPLYRFSADNESSELSTPALFDAVFPRNPAIQLEYAPLWQVYTQQADGARPPRWSLLWDLISFDGAQMRYPLHLDLSE